MYDDAFVLAILIFTVIGVGAIVLARRVKSNAGDPESRGDGAYEFRARVAFRGDSRPERRKFRSGTLALTPRDLEWQVRNGDSETVPVSTLALEFCGGYGVGELMEDAGLWVRLDDGRIMQIQPRGAVRGGRMRTAFPDVHGPRLADWLYEELERRGVPRIT